MRALWAFGAACAALASTLAFASCSSLAQRYCEAASQCDEGRETAAQDPIRGSSDDDVAVCVVQEETRLQALRSNREAVCADLANAREALMACAADAGGCKGFGEPFTRVNDACDDERDEIGKLEKQAAGACDE